MRLFNVGGGQAITPQPELDGGKYTWLRPSAAGGSYSAVCWFYGRDIYNAMPKKVPVGLISTYVGGTPVQHWTSPDGLATCEGPNTWDWPKGFLDSVLWNAMVVPLLRTVHTGVVWYQGVFAAWWRVEGYVCVCVCVWWGGRDDAVFFFWAKVAEPASTTPRL